MDDLTLLESTVSDVQAFVPGVGDYQVSLVHVLALWSPDDIEPVTHMIPLSGYDIDLVIHRVFVKVQPAVVLRGDKGVLVLALLEVHAELLLFLVVVPCYMDLIVVTHRQALRLVKQRDYLVPRARPGLKVGWYIPDLAMS